MSKAPRQPDEPQGERLTTAEQLENLRRLVSWTLWKIATSDPESDEPFRGYSVGEIGVIQGHAEALFRDANWIANVTGEYAANHLSRDDTIDWAAFKAAVEDPLTKL